MLHFDTEQDIKQFVETLDKQMSQGIDKPKVDFNLFMNVFFQYFKNPSLFINNDNMLFGKWLTLINNKTTSEVDLVNERGEIIYTLPPLIDTTSIAMSDNGLDILLKESALKEKYMTGAGNQAIEKAKNIINNNFSNNILSKWEIALNDLERIYNEMYNINSEENDLDSNSEHTLNSNIEDEFDI